MRVLVLTSEPITAEQVRGALGKGEGEGEQTEVMVVAPALNESGLKFWTADADGAIERADEVRRRTERELQQSGIETQSDTGESDPLQAIQDALQTFDADRILIFRHGGDEQRYREDFDFEEVRERFDLPVDETVLSAD
jgi:hypothetical protein